MSEFFDRMNSPVKNVLLPLAKTDDDREEGNTHYREQFVKSYLLFATAAGTQRSASNLAVHEILSPGWLESGLEAPWSPPPHFLHK